MSRRTLEQYHEALISGRAHGLGAAAARGALSLAEPVYAWASTARNVLYDTGIFRAHNAGRPVVSVGNITTGGTGKTPVVSWLAQRFQRCGLRPAILMRGYRATASGSDEQRLLQRELPGIVVYADPDRVRGAARVLQDDPKTAVFILDDGFQHRRIKRDFDLVLIDATNPFGFGHVLPRGLRREPLAALQRADAFLLTRVNISAECSPQATESVLRRYNPTAPIFHCEHHHIGLSNSDGQTIPIEQLLKRKVFTFCGLGNPAAFEIQIFQSGARSVGSARFGDHHDYSADDIANVRRDAQSAGAELVITSSKDFIKLKEYQRDGIWQVEMELRFQLGDEDRLVELIDRHVPCVAGAG